MWNRNMVTISSIYTHINMSNRVLSQYTFPRENLLPFSALFWHFVGSQSLKPKKNSAKYSNSHMLGISSLHWEQSVYIGREHWIEIQNVMDF